MKIDELISELEQVREKHGNLEVYTSNVMPERIDVSDSENLHISL